MTIPRTLMRQVDWQIFGLFIAAKMVDRGLGPAELAEMVGVHRNAIQRAISQQSVSEYTLGKLLVWSGDPLRIFLKPEMERVAA